MHTTHETHGCIYQNIKHTENFEVILCNIPTKNICTQSASNDITWFPSVENRKQEESRNAPKWGTLLQYGRADVMRTFFSPSLGSLQKFWSVR